MTVRRNDPYLASNFVVEIDDVAEIEIARVELPRSEVEEVAHRDGSSRTHESEKTPGLVRYTRLVLHRGLDGRTDFYDWWSRARDGAAGVDRNIVVTLLDEARTTEVWRWTFIDAFPVAYHFTALDGASSEFVVETLELAFDRMRIE